jgi:hypothetical protein
MEDQGVCQLYQKRHNARDNDMMFFVYIMYMSQVFYTLSFRIVILMIL